MQLPKLFDNKIEFDAALMKSSEKASTLYKSQRNTGVGQSHADIKRNKLLPESNMLSHVYPHKISEVLSLSRDLIDTSNGRVHQGFDSVK